MELQNQITFIKTLLPLAGVLFLIAAGVILLTQQFRKNLYREQLEQEKLKGKYQKELLRSGILTQEKERKRIAKDIHDELGAVLSITRMHLLQAERKYGSDNQQLQSELQNIRRLTENSIDSARKISHQLMPPQLEQFGILKTLESVCGQLNNTGTITASFVCRQEVESPGVDEFLQLTLYRVCMELINNTIKHSDATTLRLVIDDSDATWVIWYEDNGKGMDASYTGKGMGLNSIKERIVFLDGEVVFNSVKKGFSVTITLPLASTTA